MTLAEKLKHLRRMEGALKGLNRPLTKAEVIRELHKKFHRTISAAYLTQIEKGLRPHLTQKTRALLAKFFKVHPGYLVDDPPGFHADLLAELALREEKLDKWLRRGAERFRRDPEVAQALIHLAQQPDTRKHLLMMNRLLKTPSVLARLSRQLKQVRHTSRSPRGHPHGRRG